MLATLLADASDIIKGSAGQACASACNTTATLPGIIGSITKVLIFLVGALAVLFVIVGALRYTVSNGDAKRVADAKNTLTYAITGLVLSILAYAIVKFVITNIK